MMEHATRRRLVRDIEGRRVQTIRRYMRLYHWAYSEGYHSEFMVYIMHRCLRELDRCEVKVVP